MDRPTKFWDRIAEKYSKKPVADETAYQKKLAITREYLTPETTVLEFGCGTGSTAIAHAPYVKHIEAIDFSAKMIEIATRKAAAANTENVTFKQASIGELNSPDASYDAVLGLSILHLLDDRRAAIGKVWAMLKPGGVFVSSTACLGDGMNFMRPILWFGQLFGLVPYVDFFSSDELLADLRNAGFEIAHEWRPGKNKGVFIVARKPAA